LHIFLAALNTHIFRISPFFPCYDCILRRYRLFGTIIAVHITKSQNTGGREEPIVHPLNAGILAKRLSLSVFKLRWEYHAQDAPSIMFCQSLQQSDIFLYFLSGILNEK